MTSEVTFDLKFEISGLDNPYFCASLASTVLPRRRRKKPNIIPRPACSYLSAGKNTQKIQKMHFKYFAMQGSRRQ